MSQFLVADVEAYINATCASLFPSQAKTPTGP